MPDPTNPADRTRRVVARYRAALQRLETLAGELEAALDDLIITEAEGSELVNHGVDVLALFEEADDQVLNVLARIARAPDGVFPPDHGSNGHGGG